MSLNTQCCFKLVVFYEEGVAMLYFILIYKEEKPVQNNNQSQGRATC